MERWSVDAEPLIRIGMLEGVDAFLFSDVEDAVRLPDGRVVVADGGSGEIRYFAADGRHLQSTGQEGDGPGEFSRLSSITNLPPDSLLIWDAGSTRITVLDGEGHMARELDLPNTFVGFEFVGRLGEHLFLLTPPSRLVPVGPEGVHRNDRPFIRYDAAGRAWDTVAVVSGNEFEVVWIESIANWGARAIPFGRTSIFAFGDSAWVEGTSDRFSLRMRNLNGSVVRIIRYPAGERAVTSGEVADLQRRTVAHRELDPEGRRRIREFFSDTPVPDLRPAYSKILVSEGEDLWVEEWHSSFAPPASPATRWWVFESDGRLIAEATLPSSFELFQISREWALGVETDELDVERIVVYALDRNR